MKNINSQQYGNFFPIKSNEVDTQISASLALLEDMKESFENSEELHGFNLSDFKVELIFTNRVNADDSVNHFAAWKITKK